MKNKPYFIAIEGPIGIGKTSLATLLSKHYNYHLLKEIVYENPFLDKFYDDIDSWAFQTEMFFLTNRYKQLTDIQKDFLDNQKSVVSDYHLFKNAIFSKMTLDVNNFNKYQKIYHILEEDLPKPNVIIIVNATLETIMKRIKMRNRHFEQNIDPNYLQTLIDSYHEYTALLKENHEEIKVIELNGDELDYVNNPKHLQLVIKKIDEMIGQED